MFFTRFTHNHPYLLLVAIICAGRTIDTMIGTTMFTLFPFVFWTISFLFRKWISLDIEMRNNVFFSCHCYMTLHEAHRLYDIAVKIIPDLFNPIDWLVHEADVRNEWKNKFRQSFDNNHAVSKYLNYMCENYPPSFNWAKFVRKEAKSLHLSLG